MICYGVFQRNEINGWFFSPFQKKVFDSLWHCQKYHHLCEQATSTISIITNTIFYIQKQSVLFKDGQHTGIGGSWICDLPIMKCMSFNHLATTLCCRIADLKGNISWKYCKTNSHSIVGQAKPHICNFKLQIQKCSFLERCMKPPLCQAFKGLLITKTIMATL